MMKQDKSNAILSAIIAGFLIFQVVLGIKMHQDYESKVALVMHTEKVIRTSQELLSNVLNAETGQRGYLLTFDSQYLLPYEEGKQKIWQTLSVLQDLSLDSHQQQKRLTDIENLLSKKFSELNQTIVATQNDENVDKALEIMRLGMGESYMNEIRGLITAFVKEENNQLALRNHELNQASFSYLGLIAIEILLLGLFITLYRRQNHRIKTQIEDLSKVNASVQKQKAKYQYLMSAATNGLHILDLEGNVIECSESFAEMLGYSYDEAMHLNVADWDVRFPKDQLKNIIHNLVNKSEIFETKHCRKDGTIIDVQINAKGVEIDGDYYLYAAARDVSENVRLLEEAQKAKSTADNANLAKFRILSEYEP